MLLALPLGAALGEAYSNYQNVQQFTYTVEPAVYILWTPWGQW